MSEGKQKNQNLKRSFKYEKPIIFINIILSIYAIYIFIDGPFVKRYTYQINNKKTEELLVSEYDNFLLNKLIKIFTTSGGEKISYEQLKYIIDKLESDNQETLNFEIKFYDTLLTLYNTYIEKNFGKDKILNFRNENTKKILDYNIVHNDNSLILTIRFVEYPLSASPKNLEWNIEDFFNKNYQGNAITLILKIESEKKHNSPGAITYQIK